MLNNLNRLNKNILAKVLQWERIKEKQENHKNNLLKKRMKMVVRGNKERRKRKAKEKNK